LYAAYKDKVEFFIIYISEAHPVRESGQGGASADSRPPQLRGPAIVQTRSVEERALAATDCLKGLKLSLPVLIDAMDGPAEKAYGGWPAATAVVDIDGKVCFYSRGPGGARPKEAEAILKSILAGQGKFRPGEPPAEKPAPKVETPPPAPKGATPKAEPARPPAGGQPPNWYSSATCPERV